MMYDKDIVHCINNSTSLRDLENNLKEEEIIFDSYNKYLKTIRKEWSGYKRPELDAVWNSAPKVMDDLPFKDVELGGNKYLIYGLVHGNSTIPGHTNCSPDVKEFIRGYLLSYESNGGCFLEEGMGSLFIGADETENIEELEDVTYAEKLKKRLPQYPRAIKHGSDAAKLITLPIAYAGMETLRALINALGGDSKNNVIRTLYLQSKALKEKEYQYKQFDYYEVYKLPEPIQLEMQYLTAKNPIIDILVPNAAFCSVRSKYIAKNLLRWRNRMDEDVIRHVGGGGHVSEIIYFLEHPNYSFKDLEKYRLEINRRKKTNIKECAKR